MGSCLSYPNHLDQLPSGFVKIPIHHKIRCKLCMKSVKYGIIRCINGNHSIGHPYCFKLWHSINSNCPICN